MVEDAAAADADADAEAAVILRLATRALRRTVAINLSRVVGCGAGIP